ncbi:MAG TPA: hypothetical protein PLI09_02155 [Candidatus Hydrogenedentes bacterium]|nr:hypothetical protein [Candidatus Hydrogenedentota bacterium]
MQHPFEKCSAQRARRWFLRLLAGTAVLMALLTVVGMPLGKIHTASGGRCDIVSYEIAGTVDRSGAIVTAWKENGVLPYAKWNTWLDYLFLICYPNAVALGLIILIARPMSGFWQGLGRILAWAQWLVLASDALENAALLHILYRGVSVPWPQLALICASVKFTLLAGGLLGLLILFLLARRSRG